MRHLRTSANADGSATTHVFASCTLEDISRATSLRVEDIAFALHECGLLRRVRTLDGDGMDDAEDKDVIVVSREMVEAVEANDRLTRERRREHGRTREPADEVQSGVRNA